MFKPATLQRIIAIVILLIAGTQFADWLFNVASQAWGGAIAVISAAIYIYCYRMARLTTKQKLGFMYYFWMTVPTVLLVAIPFGAMAWQAMRGEENRLTDWFQWIWFIIKLPLPVALLLVVYYCLDTDEPIKPAKQEPNEEVAT